MDLALTPDQVRIRDVCRALAEDFAGRAREHDRDASSPLKDYEALRDAGLYGLMVPKELGGWGAGFVGYAIAAEELAQGSPATAMSFNMHCALVGLAFKLPLPEAVKQQIADLVVKEGKLICGSLSEAGHTGRPLRQPDLLDAAPPHRRRLRAERPEELLHHGRRRRLHRHVRPSRRRPTNPRPPSSCSCPPASRGCGSNRRGTPWACGRRAATP